MPNIVVMVEGGIRDRHGLGKKEEGVVRARRKVRSNKTRR
jgi:hypothetical protein